jgi:hypothetical protein
MNQYILISTNSVPYFPSTNEKAGWTEGVSFAKYTFLVVRDRIQRFFRSGNGLLITKIAVQK